MKKSFKEVLIENDRKTKMVIFTFLTFYLFIGVLADILLIGVKSSQGSFLIALEHLLTFKQIPVLTIIMLSIGLVTVWITFKMYDSIMLFGTEFEEIDINNAQLALTKKQLYNIIEELKISANLSYMPKVYLIHAPYMNAFASGYSEKSAMVAITTGLIEKLNRAEIQAVMAHELSHIKHMDIKITLFVGVLSNIMLLVVDWLAHLVGFSSTKKEKESNVAAIFILLLRIVLPLINLLLTLYLSRTRELMADAGAVQLTRDNQAMASALKKINYDYNLHNYIDEGSAVRAAAYIHNPNKSFLNDLFSTHPSLEKRLEALGVKKNQDFKH